MRGSASIDVAATGLVLLGVARYRCDLRGDRQRLAEFQPAVVDTPFGRVEYAQAGDGPPVLVVHGVFGGFDFASAPAIIFSQPVFWAMRLFARSRLEGMSGTPAGFVPDEREHAALREIVDGLFPVGPRACSSPPPTPATKRRASCSRSA